MRFAFMLAALLVAGPALAYQEQSLCVDIVVAADTDDERYIAWPHKGTWEITDIMWAPATAVAAAATDVQVITVAVNAGVASTTWTTLASFTTDSDDAEVAFVIGTVVDLTVTKPANLSRGYQIRVENTNGGTGPVFDGAICVAARKV